MKEAAQDTSKIPRDDPHAWSSLWRAGVLHSCGKAFQGNYSGPLQAFWQQRFDALGDGDRMVDIGTGNGAIPLLASQNARRRGIDLDLHGVDIADIDPPACISGGQAMYAGIRFHPRTSALSLPFADASVHLLTSQYALEYMPRAQAIREALRVMGYDGAAAFVLHSDDSIISATLSPQLRGLDWLFGQSELLARTRQLIAHHTMKSQPPSADATIRAEFESAMREFMNVVHENPSTDILRKVTGHLRNILSLEPAGAMAALDRTERSLRDEHERLRQLQRAILTQEDFDQLAEVFASTGRRVTVTPIDHVPGTCMGRTMMIERA
ncbi:class I SAM-dependent methyltransferase [Stenotrophomonas sp. MMGLT7]|uniref:class I SAM-dependent methyltransferase n=1 Tax=Stenotrophomonas sp. MMGLT7 TaxID=2901227 RepID=UPI001E58B8DD|nr:class I SAM-dependent methyltransferase [Stenotrophomonas sp. MMGLT7]MCD7100068.1 class I SAM-dependent methyltransferase [Stenotrophomonas sp. MMGLT7]